MLAVFLLKVSWVVWVLWKPVRRVKKMVWRRRYLSQEQMLTDPVEAADFVKQTGVDALAIACGTRTVHTSLPPPPPTDDILAIDRIKAIHASIPNTPPSYARFIICSTGMAGDH